MRVVSVSAEFSPWCKTGGLGDVASALPEALTDADEHLEYLSIVPLYRVAKASLSRAGRRLSALDLETRHVVGGRRWSVRYFELAGEPRRRRVIFAACDPLFGGPDLYSPFTFRPRGQRAVTPSEGARFAVLSAAAVRVAPRLLGAPVDVFHLHDWHAALLPWIVRHKLPRPQRPKTILTIHNLAYQGWFPAKDLPEFGVEGDDGVHFLRRGVECADSVTTVSPSYAQEVRTEAFGCGMHGLLAERDVKGILNGIDAALWEPSSDPELAASFDADDLAGRDMCRRALWEEAGWGANSESFTLGVVSRLDPQKGLDWVAKMVPKLKRLGARLVLLGTGDSALETRFRELSERYPEACAAWLTFDLGRARRIFAGADAILVPSRFEPCGLTQLYGMRYGAVPIVNPVGGLRDTVVDVPVDKTDRIEGTGFHMTAETPKALIAAVRRAAELHASSPETWRRVQRRGMASDWTWSKSALDYLKLMSDLCSQVR